MFLRVQRVFSPRVKSVLFFPGKTCREKKGPLKSCWKVNIVRTDPVSLNCLSVTVCPHGFGRAQSCGVMVNVGTAVAWVAFYESCYLLSFFLRPLPIIAWKLAWCLPGIKLFMSSCNLGLSMYVCVFISETRKSKQRTKCSNQGVFGNIQCILCGKVHALCIHWPKRVHWKKVHWIYMILSCTSVLHDRLS